MEKLDPKTDGRSVDIVAENIEKLKTLFPEVFTEGGIDFEALKETLGDYIEGREERYSFTWNGKSKARLLAQTPSTGTLRPCPEESVNWDTTQNLFIEGDNLEVLKLLQKSYNKKVKMIYIDPPYNTGNDFIYPDDFRDNIKNYLELTGQVDNEGRKISNNSETSGRYHTDWLNMISPRLKLARNLLRDEGVIFISIDDNEVANLRKVCDEVFGEENFLGTIVWKNATDNNPSRIAVEHEYIHVYARQLDCVDTVWKSKVSDLKSRLSDVGRDFVARYNNQEERQEAYTKWFRDNKPYLWPLDRYKYIDDDGIYTGSQSVHNPGKEGYRYDILHPKTGKPCKQPLMGYRFPPETMSKLLAESKVLFGEDENKIIELKVSVDEFEDKLSSVITLDGRLGAYDIRNLFPEYSKVFTNPKPIRLLSDIISFLINDGDIILDFFSGSCSSAHSTLYLNTSDFGKRRFLMVQLPEPLNSKTDAGKNALSLGFKTIADIGKERIRRVIKKIKDSTPNYKGDLGFKVFKLDSTNIKPWDVNFDNLEHTLDDYITNIKDGRSEHDILYEILLKYGLELTLPIEERNIAEKTVFVIGYGALVICLADDITLETVEGIAGLKKELQPEIMHVVFKDIGFKDDVVKTNAVQILKLAGIEDVKSL
jgi:adenine-specific DNA-methyltransferase